MKGKPYQDEQWLREQYLEKAFTKEAIGRLCGVSKTTIHRWMQIFHIPARSSGWHFSRSRVGREYQDKQWLQEQYLDNGLSQRRIAELCNCPVSVIGKWMEKHGIPARERARYNVIKAPDWTFSGWRIAKTVWCDYQISARRKECSFNLAGEQFLELITGTCFYCGRVPIENTKRINGQRRTFEWNGIDRKDNAQGYTVENCVTCCKQCNYAKHGMSYDEFIDWLAGIYGYWDRCVKRYFEGLSDPEKTDLDEIALKIMEATRRTGCSMPAEPPFCGEEK